MRSSQLLIYCSEHIRTFVLLCGSGLLIMAVLSHEKNLSTPDQDAPDTEAQVFTYINLPSITCPC